MSKSLTGKSKYDKDHYWNGVFTGVFLGAFFICIAIFFFIRVQGLRIAINPEQLAGTVQLKIQNQAKQEIPQILEDIKRDLPQAINSNLVELEGLTIGFGKSQVKLPDEVINEIRAEFSRIIETAILNTLNNYNTVDYEERIGKDAYEMINNLLREEIIGKTYIIKASQWFSLPVKIVGSTEKQFQIGI